MTPRSSSANPQRSGSVMESVAYQLHSWKPFQLHHQTLSLDSKPYFFSTKKPCRFDRSTAPTNDPVLDLSRLSLKEEPHSNRVREDVLLVQEMYKRWFARKWRRRGSRSVSGQSSTTRVTLIG